MWFHLLNCEPFTSVILTVNQMRQLRLLSDKTRIWPRVISTATSVWATSRCVLLRLGVRDFKEEVTFISYKLNEGKYEKRPSFWVVDDPPEKNYQCLSIRFTAFTTQARAFKIASTGLMSSVKSDDILTFPSLASQKEPWESADEEAVLLSPVLEPAHTHSQVLTSLLPRWGTAEEFDWR